MQVTVVDYQYLQEYKGVWDKAVLTTSSAADSSHHLLFLQEKYYLKSLLCVLLNMSNVLTKI